MDDGGPLDRAAGPVGQADLRRSVDHGRSGDESLCSQRRRMAPAQTLAQNMPETPPYRSHGLTESGAKPKAVFGTYFEGSAALAADFI